MARFYVYAALPRYQSYMLAHKGQRSPDLKPITDDFEGLGEFYLAKLEDPRESRGYAHALLSGMGYASAVIVREPALSTQRIYVRSEHTGEVQETEESY